ncbi:hypothetical protein [uncultured Chitinophaga sp.]|jgi:hypothetical protein|uniref:hypothetical protein n=1 Tax=uncultured Chitinophaga sp. TaxID=339340 RepID=UPI002603EAA0|nr:hypothetical protein [uncultured Chitinophaga sp.]
MAILKEGIEFTGGLGQVSAYKMKGSDKIIVRKKAGPTRKQILHSRKFERTRENMSEFIGVGKAVRAIRYPLIHVKRLSGYNFTSSLTTICKKMQLLDTVGEKGKRSIFLSQHRYMLAGFMLHRTHPFVSIVTGPINCTLNRETQSAVIQLPQLVQGVNLNLPWKQPMFRFCLSLGLVPDVVHDVNGYDDYATEWSTTKLDTPWQVVTDPLPAQTLALRLNRAGGMKDSQTLLFAIGVEMGAPGLHGQIEEVKHAGSACILAVG